MSPAAAWVTIATVMVLALAAPPAADSVVCLPPVELKAAMVRAVDVASASVRVVLTVRFIVVPLVTEQRRRAPGGWCGW